MNEVMDMEAAVNLGREIAKHAQWEVLAIFQTPKSQPVYQRRNALTKQPAKPSALPQTHPRSQWVVEARFHASVTERLVWDEVFTLHSEEDWIAHRDRQPVRVARRAAHAPTGWRSPYIPGAPRAYGIDAINAVNAGDAFSPEVTADTPADVPVNVTTESQNARR